MAGEEKLNEDQRVSVIEANVKHLERSIGSIGDSINDGFKDVRKAVSDGLTEVHRRVDNVEQRSQTSWPLVISFITLGGLILSGMVAFVTMTVAPVKEHGKTNSAAVAKIHDQEVASADMRGYYRAKIEDGEKRIGDLEAFTAKSFESDSSSLEHRRNLERWISHIDEQGPRGLCYDCAVKEQGETK